MQSEVIRKLPTGFRQIIVEIETIAKFFDDADGGLALRAGLSGMLVCYGLGGLLRNSRESRQ